MPKEHGDALVSLNIDTHLGDVH